MRAVGMVLMVLGGFCLVAATLAVFGPTMRTNGIDVFASVTSVKGVAASGALLLVLGAAMRRSRARQGERKG